MVQEKRIYTKSAMRSQHCSARGKRLNKTEINVHAAWLESLALEDQSILHAASLRSIPESSSHHGHHYVFCRVSGGGKMFRYEQVRRWS